MDRRSVVGLLFLSFDHDGHGWQLARGDRTSHTRSDGWLEGGVVYNERGLFVGLLGQSATQCSDSAYSRQKPSLAAVTDSNQLHRLTNNSIFQPFMLALYPLG